MLPYYGAETFGLNAVGQQAVRSGDVGVLDLTGLIRDGGVQLGLFGAGLLVFAAAGVLVAVALWHSGAAARWSGVVFAAGPVLYLPQFFGPPALRMAHGVLFAVGCVLVAWATAARTRSSARR
ncbi:hypothetical protein [Actinokineospora sp.]|uniref:hypothetical protein n=1 Tax=Actinokineospora sp. TaxID=1872133 RepID=UPI004037D2C6